MDIFVQGVKTSGSCFCLLQEIQLPEPEFQLVVVGSGSEGADDAKLLARLATDLGVSSELAVLSEAGRKMSRTVALYNFTKTENYETCGI